MKDLKDRILRPTTSAKQIFADPSRYYRAIRFCICKDMSLTPELEAYIKQNGARDIKKCPADQRWSLSKEFNKMKASDKYFLPSMKRLMELGMIYGQPQASKEEIKASICVSDLRPRDSGALLQVLVRQPKDTR